MSTLLYPKKRKDIEKGSVIEFGGLQYKYLYASRLQSGEVKEYYKCVSCPARLQYFKKTGTISLTTKHTTPKCLNNLDKWKRNVEKIRKLAEKSLKVIKEETELDCFTCLSSDVSSTSFFDNTLVDPKTSSEKEEVEVNKSLFEKTIYPEMETIIEEEEDETEEDQNGDITIILDETDLCDPENVGNLFLGSPIRPTRPHPVYLPTPSVKRSTLRSFSGKILNTENHTTHNSTNLNHKLTFQVPANSPQQAQTNKRVRFSESVLGEQSFVSRVLKK